MKREKRHSGQGIFWGQYRGIILMFLGYVGIFAAIFSLYDLEVEAVLYAGGLCVLLTGIVWAAYFASRRRKHRQRQWILENIPLMLDELPAAETLAEADYQEMLLALKRSFDANLAAWQNERRESMDYYTTWVHQIKTPISVMRMLLQGEDTEEHRELSAELFRIEQYVEMVLNYLRLGSETSDFLFREHALDSIIKQAVHKYAPMLVRNRIRFFYEPTKATVVTDEKWLLFVIEQILSNAIKYTPEGEVSITVTEDEVLEIRDTGMGIAPEDLPRIFEKGFTGYNGREDKKSTGLGLYLCRLAAEKLSHKISVESAVGVGTTVLIDLHRERVEVE